MRYKLIGSNDYLIEPIKTVLENRGVKNIKNFLKVDQNVINHWNLLKNINEAVECFLQHIKKESKIFVQVDSDP